MRNNTREVPRTSTENERAAFSLVADVLRYLRGPSGCSWDRRQTLESIRANMLEESAELIEAIHHHEDARRTLNNPQNTEEGKDHKNSEAFHLREEFGDVLLVWLMMVIIYEEQETGALETVLRELKEKLIRRHPHVFAEQGAKEKDDAELSKQWEAIKTQQEGKPYRHVSFENFHPALDVLERTRKIQKQLAKQAVGESHRLEIPQLIETIRATLATLEKDSSNAEDHIAQVLYHVVEISRICKVSPTAALMRYNSHVE